MSTASLLQSTSSLQAQHTVEVDCQQTALCLNAFVMATLCGPLCSSSYVRSTIGLHTLTLPAETP
jgi:hypothetical protein